MAENDPLARLSEVPAFELTSTDVAEGGQLAAAQMSGMLGVPGGLDVSPQLSWSAAPAATKSYALLVLDPDAPTGSGFCHWAVADLPGSVTELPANAGDPGSGLLPSGAVTLRNDGGAPRFVGAAPPAGHGRHRYFFVLQALDVESIGVGPDATPALLGFNVFSHVIGRAVLTAWAEIPAG